MKIKPFGVEVVNFVLEYYVSLIKLRTIREWREKNSHFPLFFAFFELEYTLMHTVGLYTAHTYILFIVLQV